MKIKRGYKRRASVRKRQISKTSTTIIVVREDYDGFYVRVDEIRRDRFDFESFDNIASFRAAYRHETVIPTKFPQQIFSKKQSECQHDCINSQFPIHSCRDCGMSVKDDAWADDPRAGWGYSEDAMEYHRKYYENYDAFAAFKK